MAAGLSIDAEALAEFQQALEDQVAQTVSDSELQAQLITDGNLSADQITMQTAQQLREAGPWGQLFPEPSFEGVFVAKQQRIVGDKHLKLVLAPDTSPQQTIDAIYFNVDLEEWPSENGLVRCVYRLDINEYRGRESLQLMIQYMESC